MTETAQTRIDFDRDIGLSELLKAMDLAALRRVLETLLGDDMRLLEPGGRAVLGGDRPVSGAARAPFRLELEPIGYLESTQRRHLDAAVALMEILVRAAARYFMAAAVQMETVQQDYRELQEKNAQLQASEERYRLLAESLERRVAEQVRAIEAAQRQLYQAEKLASVGQLAAGVAHEINNPLGFVKSNLSSALAYVEGFGRLGTLLAAGREPAVLQAAWRHERLDQVLEDFPALLRESLEGVERVARIVSALKDFSSVDRSEEGIADVNRLVLNTCEVLAGRFGERIRLTTELAELPALRCHAGRLSQMFLNLLLNAVQAIAGRGEVRVATALEGDEIAVRIHDTGAGIPAPVLPRIFDPFFTTRDVGQGTGLGLTVARDVVRAHGGRIEVTSAVGAGTTVGIHLPVSGRA